MAVPKNGIEHWSDEYEVFCTPNFSWVGKDSDHTHAVAGGKAGNGEPFYVCRGIVNGQETPGKLYKPTGCCYIGSINVEHCIQDAYSVLTIPPSKPRNIPQNVVTTPVPDLCEYE